MSYIPEASHWYSSDGKPCHWQEKKDGSGTTPTTLAHARKLSLLPSCTTIIKILAKPALTEWLCRNAATAALTTPRIDGEALDAFLERILRKDATDESEKAKDLGTQIHAAIEASLAGQGYSVELEKYLQSVWPVLQPLGRVVWTERILIGDGYAGKADALFESEEAITLTDFKTTGKVPDKIYPEHKLQLAAYAKSLGNTGNKRIRTTICYISTKEPGLVKLIYHDDWQETYRDGFWPLYRTWCWLNQYWPPPMESDEFPHLKPTKTKLVDVPCP